MFEVQLDGKFEKTGLYTPKNEFKKIYLDNEIQNLVLGLIKFSLNKPAEKEK